MKTIDPKTVDVTVKTPVVEAVPKRVPWKERIQVEGHNNTTPAANRGRFPYFRN